MSRALTMLKHGVPVIHVAAELHVSRHAIYIYNLKRAAARLPSGNTPHRK